MTVLELINILKHFPMEADVVIDDADTNWELNINGIIQVNENCPVVINGHYGDKYEHKSK